MNNQEIQSLFNYKIKNFDKFHELLSIKQEGEIITLPYSLFIDNNSAYKFRDNSVNIIIFTN